MPWMPPRAGGSLLGRLSGERWHVFSEAGRPGIWRVVWSGMQGDGLTGGRNVSLPVLWQPTCGRSCEPLRSLRKRVIHKQDGLQA